MLKKYCILFLLLSVISFISISDFYNSSMVEKIGKWSNSNQSTQIVFKNTDGIEPTEFVEYLKNTVEKYNITILQQVSDSLNNSTNLYISSSNKAYMSNILLEVGQISDLKNFKGYSTNSKQKENRIFNLNFSEPMTIQPFEYDGLMNPFGYFGIYTNQGDPIDYQLFQLVKNEISSKYKDIIIEFNKYETTHGGLSDIMKTQFSQSFIISMLFTTLFTLIMITDLLKEQKKITCLKLNGYSNLSIFRYLIFDKIILSFLCYIVFFSLIFSVSIPFNYSIVPQLYLFSFLLAILNLMLVILFSYLLFIFILFVPINSAMKGKSYLSIAANVVMISKIILIISFIPFLSKNAFEINAFANGQINKSTLENKYKNLYSIQNMSPIKKLTDLFDTNEFQIIIDELREESNAFYFISQFEYSSDKNMKDKYKQFYIVDEQYLINQEITLPSTPLSSTSIFLNKDYKQDDSYYEFLNKCAYQNFGSLPKPNYIYYSGTADNFSELYHYSSISIENSPIFLIPEDHIKYNGLFNMYFYYQGNRKQAQNYINSKFEKFDINDPYYVSSIKESYNNFYSSSINRNTKSIFTSFLMYLVYIIVSYQYISLTFCSNKKQLFIEKCEGILFSDFVIKNLIVSSIFILLFSLLFYLSYKYFDLTYLFIIICITTVEIVLNYYFLNKTRNIGGID